VSVEARAPKFVMPSVYRSKDDPCLRCKVGYRIRNGKRVRVEFRLSEDALIANKKALLLAEKWLKEEQRHYRMQLSFKQVFGERPEDLPVWTGMPEIEAAAREEYFAMPPEDLPGDEPTTPFVQSISVKQATTEVLQRLLKKALRDSKALATYQWYETQFRLGFVPRAINPDLLLDALGLSATESYCDFWCDLKARAAESVTGTFGWRSAKNRLDALGYLLRQLKGRGNGFVYPEGVDRLLAEEKATIAGALTAIQKYDPDRVNAILAKGGDRLRLFVYCALNFGMYQADIGQQIFRQHTEEKGGMIEIAGERHLQWIRHKLLHRQRAMMRVNDEDKPVLLTHYVWPETGKLLNQFAVPTENQYNLWLLNENGLPLWRQEPDHKRALDCISTAYYRIVKMANVSQPFDQYRKFGSTACESLGSIEVQEMYRGERRQGSSRVYVLQDFAGKLTPFLKKWGEQLRADGILY
jgi:hypothetical protein